MQKWLILGLLAFCTVTWERSVPFKQLPLEEDSSKAISELITNLTFLGLLIVPSVNALLLSECKKDELCTSNLHIQSRLAEMGSLLPVWIWTQLEYRQGSL